MLRNFELLGIRFTRRPVSDPPEDGTLCCVDDGDENSWKNGQRPAQYRDGAWLNISTGRPLNMVPTFWTTFDGADNK